MCMDAVVLSLLCEACSALQHTQQTVHIVVKKVCQIQIVNTIATVHGGHAE